MPGYDKTGPFGRGSGTGRGFGLCFGAAQDDLRNRPARGFGLGRGFGRGYGAGRGGGRGMGRFGGISVIDDEIPSYDVSRPETSKDTVEVGEGIIEQLRSIKDEMVKLRSRMDKIEKK